MEKYNGDGPTRRNLVKGAAWAVPVVAAAAAAPAAAVSLRKDPGINGWVTVSTSSTSSCPKTVTYDSTTSGVGPDGAPFGLYVYDINQNPDDVLTDAEMILWLPNWSPNSIQNASSLSWTNLLGSSNCWANPTYLGSHTKFDGLAWYGWKWTYGCTIPINPVMGGDGIERVFLDDFRVQTTYNYSGSGSNRNCSYYHYITQRRIKINGEQYCFERKIGTTIPGSNPPTQDCSGAMTPYSVNPQSFQRAQSVEIPEARTAGDEGAHATSVLVG